MTFSTLKNSLWVVVGLTSGIVISGYLVGLTIPTSPATHQATLNELHIGVSGDNSIISLDKNNNVSIAGGLIVGYRDNKVINSEGASVLGGGEEQDINQIDGGDNAVIAGGRGNRITAPNSIIGGGHTNDVQGSSSLIGGGKGNTVYGNLSSIGAGEENTIYANYAVIPGGANNTIAAGADSSFVAGQLGKAQHSGTFIWSDYDDAKYRGDTFTSEKDNTFLIRSLSGMGINTNTSPAGVNVSINGAAYLGGNSKLIESGTLTTSCYPAIAGTFEAVNGCYYFCDGQYWQVTNLSFGGDDVAIQCTHRNAATKVCNLDGFKLRAGDVMTGFSAGSANDCSTVRATVTCQVDGTLNKPTHIYANCFNIP